MGIHTPPNIIYYCYLTFGTLLLFFFSSTLWFENYFFNTKPLIYTIFSIFIILNRKSIYTYLLNTFRENFKNIDFIIIISIFTHFLIQEKLNLYAISFLTLYTFIRALYEHSVKSEIDTLKLVFNCILISGIISVAGLYFGLIESIFLETNIFHQNQPLGYPNPTSKIINEITGFNLSNHISGFQTSINYSAYIIISCLGVLNFAEYRDSTKRKIRLTLITALVLTQAKIGFLYFSILIILKIADKYKKTPKLLLITFTCLGYLFLTHFTFVESGTEIMHTKYYREFYFNFLNLDYYLSLFSWLKTISFEYLMSNNIFLVDLNGFLNFSQNFEPHSLFFSCVFFGGLGFAFFLLIRLILILLNYFLSDTNKESYFSALLCAFFIESFLWDSYDSPIFWLIMLLGHSYHGLINDEKKQVGRSF